MKHLFASLELALLAKEKEFDENCLAVYFDRNIYSEAEYKDNPSFFRPSKNSKYNTPFEPQGESVAAPLYQQLMDWLREEHKIDVALIYCIEYPLDKDLRRKGYGGNVYLIDKDENIASYFGITYYDALSEGIKEALKLLK